MHIDYSAVPCPGLRRYVRAYAQRELEFSGVEVVQSYPACLEPTLSLEFRNPLVLELDDGSCEAVSAISIVGPHTYRRGYVHLIGPMETFGIFFQPLGLWQLFGIPLSLLINRGERAADVFQHGEVERLWHQLAEARSFEQRARLADEHLSKLVANVRSPSAVMNTAVHILRHGGTRRISEVASETGVSVRQFERKFSEEIGITPKLFGRIRRFQLALDARISFPTRSWLNIAHEFGYHDQMHMVRDFEDLSGATPSRILEQIGDLRPSALAGSESGISNQ